MDHDFVSSKGWTAKLIPAKKENKHIHHAALTFLMIIYYKKYYHTRKELTDIARDIGPNREAYVEAGLTQESICSLDDVKNSRKHSFLRIICKPLFSYSKMTTLLNPTYFHIFTLKFNLIWLFGM